MSAKPSPAALQRKIARLEAQIKAIHDFMQHDRMSEFVAIRKNAELEMRIEQAFRILNGEVV